MRLLITGAGGFVGSRLSHRALAAGEIVGGLFLEESVAGTWAGSGLEIFTGDILDASALERTIGEFSPEAVVHLAGLTHVGESWKRVGDYFRVNLLGTENLLAGVRRHAPEARIVLASSAEVYGAVPEEEQPISEERPLDPRTPYGLTKAAAERLALREGAVVVRSFNLVGPGQEPRFALTAFAHQLAAIERGERGAVLEVGNLSARRDFVHVDDGARGYLRLAAAGEAGEVYNLASGQAVSIEDALGRLMEISGVKAEVRPDPDRMRPVDVPLSSGDATKLRALGWRPERDLDEALRDLWQRAREDSRP